MKPPKKMISLGGHEMLLEGNLHACLDYAEITKGKGLEDAYKDLLPQLVTYEEQGTEALNREHPFKNPEPWSCLLWGFTATWRSESGWNEEHSFSDDLDKPVRKSRRFTEFVKRITFGDYRNARPQLMELLLLSLFLPTDYSPKKKAGKPSTKSSRKKQTGT